MPKLELLIPIVNVDSSILSLRLEPGYKMEAMSAAEFTGLMNQLDSEFPYSGYLSRSARLPFVNQVEKKVYMVKWSTNVNAAELKGVIAPASHLEKKFGIINRVSCIKNILKLLTICKEGTVLAPDHYEMLIDEAGETRCLSAQTSGSSIPSDMKFVIDSDEEESINKFVRETEFPFKQHYIAFAFDNFYQSYWVHHVFGFLSLFISMEALLADSDQGLAHSLARNTAVLLGEDTGECEDIYGSIKRLYDLRSDVIHGRSKKRNRLVSITVQDLLELRDYARGGIRKAASLDLEKDALIKYLNSQGYPSGKPS